MTDIREGESVAWCGHPRARHTHGTRPAYVKDRCRCGPCTAANTAASNARHRSRTYGRWAPFVDAAPVRAHIHTLRAAGIGTDQIAHLAGVSPSHVRALIYSTKAGRPPTRRVRPQTADKLLAVSPSGANRALRSLVDAAGTRRRLQALMAVGHTLPRLAAHLDRTPANLRRTMAQQRVTAATATAVRELYERLWDASPPQGSTADRAAVSACSEDSRQRGWRPPMAWDDIDNDPDPDNEADVTAPGLDGQEQPAWSDVDDIAVARAVAGDRSLALTVAEELEAVRRLTAQGRSARAIAELLDSSSSTVSRRRRQITAA